MKKFIIIALLTFCVWPFAYAYDYNDLRDEFLKDSKEVFLKNVKTGYCYDFLESDPQKHSKFSVSTQLVAWRFLAVEPMVVYTPSSSAQIAEFGLAFPIRIGYIPIGGGKLVKDLAPDTSSNGNIIDMLYMGPYMSQNLSSGNFGFGLTLGLMFGGNSNTNKN